MLSFFARRYIHIKVCPPPFLLVLHRPTLPLAPPRPTPKLTHSAISTTVGHRTRAPSTAHAACAFLLTLLSYFAAPRLLFTIYFLRLREPLTPFLLFLDPAAAAAAAAAACAPSTTFPSTTSFTRAGPSSKSANSDARASGMGSIFGGEGLGADAPPLLPLRSGTSST